MESYFDIASLLTYGGAAAATAAVTQLIKPLTSKTGIGARAVSYIVAVVLMITAAVLTGKRGAADYILCFINAVFVALSSNGGYDLVADLTDKGNEREDDDEDNT